MKKILIAAIVVTTLGLIISVNVRRVKNRGVEVRVVEVQKRDLAEKVSGSGRIEARRSVDITSGVIGKVLELAVEEGDRVEVGELILRIDPGERAPLVEQTRARLARSEAREELAQAELRQAQLHLDRARGLREGNLTSEQDVEDAATSFEIAQANLRASHGDVRDARAALDHAEYELDRTIVRADLSGIIVRLAVEQGENVLAGDLYNSGSSIVTIADLSEMEAHVLVDETEVVKLRRGQESTITIDAFPDEEIPGKVVEVGNSAYNAGALGSQEAKDFRVRVRLQEVPESLRPGLSTRAEIVTAWVEEALAVPIEALVVRDPIKEAQKGKRRSRRDRNEDDGSSGDSDESGEQDDDSDVVEGVFVVRDGEAVFVAVTTGIAGEKHFEVVKGLEEGEQIVRGPFEALRRLKTGDRLKFDEKKKRRSRDRLPADETEAESPAEEADQSEESDESEVDAEAGIAAESSGESEDG